MFADNRINKMRTVCFPGLPTAELKIQTEADAQIYIIVTFKSLFQLNVIKCITC